MSFARAFSTRRSNKAGVQTSSPMQLGRAATLRGGKPVLRSQISSPIALISTTNTRAHDSPSIAGTSPIAFGNTSSPSSSASSINSREDSDASTASIHSNDTATDASSIDESPMRCEPNHLSCYFKPAVETNTSTPTRSASSSPTRLSFDAPALPRRAPSHSKKAHEIVSRQRSVQRMKSPPATARDMSAMDSPSPTRSAFVEAPKENPFGMELAQLDEVAEEFGQVVSRAANEEDACAMQAHDLAYFGASDYLAEVQAIMSDIFADEASAWV